MNRCSWTVRNYNLYWYYIYLSLSQWLIVRKATELVKIMRNEDHHSIAPCIILYHAYLLHKSSSSRRPALCDTIPQPLIYWDQRAQGVPNSSLIAIINNLEPLRQASHHPPASQRRSRRSFKECRLCLFHWATLSGLENCLDSAFMKLRFSRRRELALLVDFWTSDVGENSRKEPAFDRRPSCWCLCSHRLVMIPPCQPRVSALLS